MRVFALGLVGVIMLGLFALLSMRLAAPVLSPLYSNLSLEDGGEIISELERMGVPYEVTANGTQILAPTNDVLRLRMLLAQKGLPSQGSIVGYEIFDQSESLGTSTFVHNVNLLRALEGELARTISSFDSIAAARVHLVVPKRRVFSRKRVEPSASVILTQKNRTQKPTRQEIAAVTHLVATAVPGLRVNRITVVDSTGKLLAKGGMEGEDGDLSAGVMASNAEEFRVTYERRVKQTVENLLEQSVGVGRVRAEVSAEIAFDRKVSNSEIYDPDGQVARSVQTTEEIESASDGTDGGNVSVANNLPENLDGPAAGGSTSTSSTERINETTNFEISKTITNHVSEVGKVERVSVAVLVDGTYEFNEETNENNYQPRSDEELEQLRTLVRTAIGFDEARGDTIEIVNMPFSRGFDDFVVDETPFDWLKRDLASILKTLVIGIVAILAILLVIKPVVNRAFEHAPATAVADAGGGGGAVPAGDIPDLPPEENIDVEQIQTKMEGASAKKINDLVDNNPDETLAVIRSWLAQKT